MTRLSYAPETGIATVEDADGTRTLSERVGEVELPDASAAGVESVRYAAAGKLELTFAAGRHETLEDLGVTITVQEGETPAGRDRLLVTTGVGTLDPAEPDADPRG